MSNDELEMCLSAFCSATRIGIEEVRAFLLEHGEAVRRLGRPDTIRCELATSHEDGVVSVGCAFQNCSADRYSVEIAATGCSGLGSVQPEVRTVVHAFRLAGLLLTDLGTPTWLDCARQVIISVSNLEAKRRIPLAADAPDHVTKKEMLAWVRAQAAGIRRFADGSDIICRLVVEEGSSAPVIMLWCERDDGDVREVQFFSSGVAYLGNTTCDLPDLAFASAMASLLLKEIYMPVRLTP
ncbi:hypothetical protein GGQ80_002979 [Sphingomonas jinjuensis]|uniref:Uncharacterized protein n=1 Tax=Sphingomonas jinjuensis TaxID=535907 RepID=A0A840FEG2_9SPHN|nr:hypothetical protein [Sphingomonas jinjuensis]MBB4155062.1 hypothetical protein [Sphingomonas jinjuensis]